MGPSFDLTHLLDYHSTPEHLGYGCELSAPLRRNILTEATTQAGTIVTLHALFYDRRS